MASWRSHQPAAARNVSCQMRSLAGRRYRLAGSFAIDECIRLAHLTQR